VPWSLDCAIPFQQGSRWWLRTVGKKVRSVPAVSLLTMIHHETQMLCSSPRSLLWMEDTMILTSYWSRWRKDQGLRQQSALYHTPKDNFQLLPEALLLASLSAKCSPPISCNLPLPPAAFFFPDLLVWSLTCPTHRLSCIRLLQFPPSLLHDQFGSVSRYHEQSLAAWAHFCTMLPSTYLIIVPSNNQEVGALVPEAPRNHILCPGSPVLLWTAVAGTNTLCSVCSVYTSSAPGTHGKEAHLRIQTGFKCNLFDHI